MANIQEGNSGLGKYHGKIVTKISKLIKSKNIKQRILIATFAAPVLLIALLIIAYFVSILVDSNYIKYLNFYDMLIFVIFYLLIFSFIAQVLFVPTFVVLCILRLFKHRKRIELILKYGQKKLLLIFCINIIPSIIGLFFFLFLCLII